MDDFPGRDPSAFLEWIKGCEEPSDFYISNPFQIGVTPHESTCSGCSVLNYTQISGAEPNLINYSMKISYFFRK
jgi:hypothetical protein